jgi:hypothetical protein
MGPETCTDPETAAGASLEKARDLAAEIGTPAYDHNL